MKREDRELCMESSVGDSSLRVRTGRGGLGAEVRKVVTGDIA